LRIATVCGLALATIVAFLANSIGKDQVLDTRFRSETELMSVFELSRHGARAPMGDPAGFTVSSHQLTPMGMRQRYLLGRYNFAKYSTHLGGKVSQEDARKKTAVIFDKLHAQSTDISRTVLSAYSEVMGLSGVIPTPELSDNQVNSLKAGKSLP